jgi:resuscitation-promoting factor RpfB
MRRRDRDRMLAAVGAGLGLAVLAHASAGANRGAPAPATVHAQAAAAPPGTAGNVALGQALATARGWTGPQWQCLDALWNRESGWNVLATYPGTITPPSAPSSSITTAYGIPQALPAQKMAAAGPDWRTSPATQIRWGLSDIAHVYGTPCAAWAHEQADGWY